MLSQQGYIFSLLLFSVLSYSFPGGGRGGGMENIYPCKSVYHYSILTAEILCATIKKPELKKLYEKLPGKERKKKYMHQLPQNIGGEADGMSY